MKALVVDDIAENVCLLETLLKVHGYAVLTASNGIEALALLEQGGVDLIISDILMPKMDGFQLCRAVKSDVSLQNIPFIFYTASYTTEKDKAFALSLGASQFVLKPADPADFIEIINAVVSSESATLLDSGVVSVKDETEYLRGHQTRLIHKLENKIAALERSEARYLSLNVELSKKNAELERFTYTVSHDLKSPLVTILGFLDLLERDIRKNDSEQIEIDFAFIQNAALKMHNLLDNLLELARSGRVISRPQPISLPVLVQQVEKRLCNQLKPVELKIDIPADLPLVSGDPVRLDEVFQNLLENAIKFSAESPEPVIEINCKAGENSVVCFVRDNGIGISEAYHEEVFGLFKKLDTSYSGTGIGLAIVRRIVEEHGGRVWVESAGEGCGSSFFFALPTG